MRTLLTTLLTLQHLIISQWYREKHCMMFISRRVRLSELILVYSCVTHLWSNLETFPAQIRKPHLHLIIKHHASVKSYRVSVMSLYIIHPVIYKRVKGAVSEKRCRTPWKQQDVPERTSPQSGKTKFNKPANLHWRKNSSVYAGASWYRADAGALHSIEGNMKGATDQDILFYIGQALNLGWRQTCQEDNDPKQTGRIIKDSLAWLSQSPALSPIEHLWRIWWTFETPGELKTIYQEERTKQDHSGDRRAVPS